VEKTWEIKNPGPTDKEAAEDRKAQHPEKEGSMA